MKVFIASPYSGNPEVNTIFQMEIADELLKVGLTPFIPLLVHYMDLKFPQPYDVWLNYTKTWISSCDVLLRVGGPSSGADSEVEEAKRIGKPVFFDIESLFKYIENGGQG